MKSCFEPLSWTSATLREKNGHSIIILCCFQPPLTLPRLTLSPCRAQIIWTIKNVVSSHPNPLLTGGCSNISQLLFLSQHVSGKSVHKSSPECQSNSAAPFKHVFLSWQLQVFKCHFWVHVINWTSSEVHQLFSF